MAKIKQGILGGFSGKVASLVGTSWKGRAVMKSLPLSVANPRTESQVAQRNKFSKVAELASAILTQFVQPVENPISGNISGYNLFCKDNKSAFTELGALDVSKFGCGGGKLINLEALVGSATEGDGAIALNWQNSAGLSPLRSTDKVYAAAFLPDGTFYGVLSGEATRADGRANIQIDEDVQEIQEGDKFVVIYAVISADGRDVSVFTNAVEITAQAD